MKCFHTHKKSVLFSSFQRSCIVPSTSAGYYFSILSIRVSISISNAHLSQREGICSVVVMVGLRESDLCSQAVPSRCNQKGMGPGVSLGKK